MSFLRVAQISVFLRSDKICTLTTIIIIPIRNVTQYVLCMSRIFYAVRMSN